MAMTTPEARVPRYEGGYSIIAVMVAIVLLSVGILAISNAATQVVVLETNMASRTTALEIGRAYMESVRSRDPLTLESEDPVTVNDTGEEDAEGVFQRELVVEEAGRNISRVVIRIDGPKLANPLELTTLAYTGSF